MESSRHSHHRRRSGSRSNETHTRPRSHQSHHSEHDSDQEIRGCDMHRRSFQDIQQNPSSHLRYRPQSRSSHSSRHTDARQEQESRESVVNIEVSVTRSASNLSLLYSSNHRKTLTPLYKIRPSTRRHSSMSSNGNASSIPSHDSGYGGLGPEQ